MYEDIQFYIETLYLTYLQFYNLQDTHDKDYDVFRIKSLYLLTSFKLKEVFYKSNIFLILK